MGENYGRCGKTLTYLAAHCWIGLVAAPSPNISSVLTDFQFQERVTNSTWRRIGTGLCPNEPPYDTSGDE